MLELEFFIVILVGVFLLDLSVVFNVFIFGYGDFMIFDFCCCCFLFLKIFFLVYVFLLVMLSFFFNFLSFFRSFVWEFVDIKFFIFV